MEASSIGMPHNDGLEIVSIVAETKPASTSKTEASPLALRTKLHQKAGKMESYR